MGVAALFDLINKRLKQNATATAAIVGAVCVLVPIQMASQTWDDHDRSNRYTCRDYGQNYLMTLQEKGNPIIFTNGDNDTFPLWYNQEVEGVRTDARVCNLSYVNTDWYIDQMKRPAYNSPALPISWPRLDYCSGTNEYVRVNPAIKAQVLDFFKHYPEEAKKQFGDEPFELHNIMKYWVRSKDEDMHVIPTDTIYLKIDKEAVKKSGMMMACDSIPDHMVISLAGKTALYKGELMMLEIIAQCNWTRPVYVATTVGEGNYLNLGNNFVREGLANRITPFTTSAAGARKFDTEKTYQSVMHRYKWGGLEKPGLYLDETVMRMCYTHRHLLNDLALQLIAEGQLEKAKNVVQLSEKVLPAYNVPYTYISGATDLARAYALLGMKDKAMKIARAVLLNNKQYACWYLSLSKDRFLMSQNDVLRNILMMQNTADVMAIIDQKAADKVLNDCQTLYKLYLAKGGTPFEGAQEQESEAQE